MPYIFASSEKSVGNRVRSNGGRKLGSRSPRTRCGIARLQLYAVRSQLPFRTSLPSPVRLHRQRRVVGSGFGLSLLPARVSIRLPSAKARFHCQSKTESGNLGESR